MTLRLLALPLLCACCALAQTSRCYRQLANVTTRALGAEDIIRYFDKVLDKPELIEATAFGELPQGKFKPVPQKQHACALNLWETAFELGSAQSIAFAAREQHTAWCILLDGAPVAEWTKSALRKGIHACEATQVSPGRHTIQMLSIQRQGENPPGFAMSINDGDFAPLRAMDNWTEVLPPMDFGKKSGNYSFTATGVRHIQKSANVLRFEPARQCFLRARLLAFPAIVAEDALIHLELKLEACPGKPGIFQEIQGFATYNENGQKAKVDMASVGDGKFTLDFHAPNAAEITMEFRHGGCLVAVPLHLRLLYPEASLDGIGLRNEHLTVNDAPAICVIRKREKMVPSPALPQPLGPYVLFDDLTGSLLAPGAVESLGNILREMNGKIPIGVTAVPPQTSLPQAQLLALASLPQKEAFTPIFYCGLGSIQSCISPKEAARHLLFLVQHCKAHGMPAILMTLPKLPVSSRENARLLALYTKEIGIGTATPVLDLYSMSLIENANTETWMEHENMGLGTINDTARKWLARQMLKQLAAVEVN